MGECASENYYICPYTDFGFRKLFGTEKNKDLPLSFINSLLQGRENFKSLRYLDMEQPGTRTVLNVCCENDCGEPVLVELQLGEYMAFDIQSLYHASFPIREQMRAGKWKAVYVIVILNFTLDMEDEGDFFHEVQLMDRRTNEVFYENLTFIYLEMPKFNKREDELDGMSDKWMFALRNLADLTKRPAALQDKVFDKLFRVADTAKLTVEEYRSYEDSLKTYRDWRSVIDTAEHNGWEQGYAEGFEEGREEGRKQGREEGFEEGREEGREQGREEGRRLAKIARQMKANGASVESIVQATGIPAELIERI